jgi:rare lipoprotein A
MAAHKTMPLPSYARVTNLSNGRSIVVRVNDRGPYVGSRVIDVSEKTAELLDMKRHGLGKVRVQYVARAGLAGSDSRVLAATLTGPGINSGRDERTLLAQADLRSGPRQNLPANAPIMVASTAPTAPMAPAGAGNGSLFGKAQATPAIPARTTVAFAPVTDASSFELAGADARIMRAALLAAKPAPMPTTVAVVARPADGAPMSILPVFAPRGTVAATDDETAPGIVSRSSSYAAAERISAAHTIFSSMGRGDHFASLVE